MKYNCNCDPCSDGCKPAHYGCDWNIQADPYNSSVWVVTANGMSHKVRIPKLNETDTNLRTDYTSATLRYDSEKHKDVITGEQLGDIIQVEDLRDVDIDPSLAGTCYELVFQKYAECGEGCQSVANKWHNVNINSEGVKQDWLNFPRGANAYGCPVYLDEPTNTNQYWFAGWRQDGEHKEFGYFQPKSEALPKDALGNYIVMSQDPNTKQPIVGSLPLDCILRNLVGSLGMDIFGTWSVVTSTPAFSSTFNNVTGDWSIDWSDWDSSLTTHYGSGRITGKLDWDAHFNTTNGHMEYHVTAIHYYVASYTHDAYHPGPTYPKLTFWAVANPGGTETKLIDAYSYTTNDDWTININQTFSWDQTISVAPNQTVGPFNYSHIFVDWVADDNGYTQVNFKNKLAGWEGC